MFINNALLMNNNTPTHIKQERPSVVVQQLHIYYWLFPMTDLRNTGACDDCIMRTGS
jgi:hypothetical protein